MGSGSTSPEGCPELPQIPLQGQPRVGVDGRGVGPLVLAHDRHQVAGDDKWQWVNSAPLRPTTRARTRPMSRYPRTPLVMRSPSLPPSAE